MKYGISAEGATVPRQVMEHVVRNPCKREPSRIKVLKGRQKTKINMASALVKINVHIIFHVKSNGIRMRENDLKRIFSYMGGIINRIGGVTMDVGGLTDHIHIVASLPKTKTLSDFVKNIKSDSSRWLKSIDSYYDKFAWQEGYGAFSVSPTLLDKTINYVKNQSQHHKTMSFREEYESFLKAYEIQYDERYAFDD